MRYYAIREKATGRFLAGTNFGRVDGKVTHIFASVSHPPLLFGSDHLGKELRSRHIDMVSFEVVVVEIKAVKS